nr:hypothetical protein [Tanacetum cinerariifolium]
MVYRHPDAAINDPRPAAGSFNMADVRRLSAHVIKLKDMPEGMLVLSGLSRVWKSRVYDLVLRGVNGNVMGIYDFLCLPEWTGAEVQEEPQLDVRPTLQRLLFYCTPPTVADDVIPDPALEDLAIGTPISKIVSKAEASQKQKFSTSDAALSHVAKRTSFGFERVLSMHQTKDEFVVVLKKMLNFIPGLEPEKLVHPANVPIPKDTRVSPPIAKELTVTPISKSLELSANVSPASFVVALEHNEEQVNDVADGLDLEMADGVPLSKSINVFVQGISHILDDVVEVTAVESKCVSSGPTDVVVALFVGGKGDVLIPSSIAGGDHYVSSSSLMLKFRVLTFPSIYVRSYGVNDVVDGLDLEMADGVPLSKSRNVFVQGISYILDDVVEVTAVESKCVSSGPTDVVVALFVGGKGDVLIPSSIAGKKAAVNSSRV